MEIFHRGVSCTATPAEAGVHALCAGLDSRARFREARLFVGMTRANKACISVLGEWWVRNGCLERFQPKLIQNPGSWFLARDRFFEQNAQCLVRALSVLSMHAILKSMAWADDVCLKSCPVARGSAFACYLSAQQADISLRAPASPESHDNPWRDTHAQS